MECRAVCQNDTLQRAALQSCLALNTFHPPSQSIETTLRRGQQLRRTNYSTTILRPSASRLSHHLPRSLSLSPSVSSRYLPAYNLSSYLYHTYNLYHTYTITCSLSNGSLSRFTLLALLLFPFLSSHLSSSDSTVSFLPILFSATDCNLYISFFLFPSLLSFLVSRSIARSLACPFSHPRAYQ